MRVCDTSSLEVWVLLPAYLWMSVYKRSFLTAILIRVREKTEIRVKTHCEHYLVRL